MDNSKDICADNGESAEKVMTGERCDAHEVTMKDDEFDIEMECGSDG